MHVRIRQDGDKVLLAFEGFEVMLHWDAALQLAQQIHAQAKRAEEIAKSEDIILDGALMLRLGIPLGMSDNPHLKQEIAKEAAWNSELRRALPGGVKSNVQYGVAALRKRPTKG